MFLSEIDRFLSVRQSLSVSLCVSVCLSVSGGDPGAGEEVGGCVLVSVCLSLCDRCLYRDITLTLSSMVIKDAINLDRCPCSHLQMYHLSYSDSCCKHAV